MFAHSLHAIDFSNALIKADCDKLDSHRPLGVASAPKNSKEKYLWNVLGLYHGLRGKLTALYTAKALRGEKTT